MTQQQIIEHKEYLFLAVPEDAHDFVIDMGYLIFKIYDMSDWVTDAQIECDVVRFLTTGKSRFDKGNEGIKKHTTGIKMADGKLQIIGKADSLSDKYWEGIVERDGENWEDYDYAPHRDFWRTATKSGHSLLKSLNLEPETTLILKKIEK